MSDHDRSEPDDATQPRARRRRADTGASPHAGRRRRRGRAAGGPEDDHPSDEAASSGRPRRSRRSEARRRRTRNRALLALAVVVAAVAAVFGITAVVELDRGGGAADGPAVTAPDALPGDPQPVLTVVTLAGDAAAPEAATADDDAVVASVALLAIDRATGAGTVLVVPPATSVDVPGHGSLPLRDAFALGGAPLVAVSLDGLLEVRTDAVATLTEAGWTELLTALGPASEDAGTLAATLAGSGEPTSLELLPEVGAGYLDALDRIVAAPEQLGAVLEDGPQRAVAPPTVTAAAEGEDDGEAAATGTGVVHTVFAELAAARAQGAVTAEVLAVSPAADDPDGTVLPEGVRIQAFVDDRLAASRVDREVADGVPVQVLDGNGVEGVLDLVAQVLEPAGYELRLTGNADRDDHEVTRIVVHDEEPETLAAARDVRDRLGVGTIERAGTPLSVVDVTVVVGLDFPVGGEAAP